MRIFLAPMEGVLDHHLRFILSQIGGIDLCVTEFVRVTDHVLPQKVFLRYSPELAQHRKSDELTSIIGASCPTRIQLLGSNADAIAANARKAALLGAPGIDLNFGCPAKTVNRHRGGACLLKEPDTLFKIVSQTRAAVPQATPVSAKIRLGYEDRSAYMDTSQAIFEAGADELVVHARSKADGYRPPAYWECISDIRQALSIPVVANGEIWSPADYLRCKEASGCRDIMLGRGLLATPDLALAIKAYINNTPYKPMSWPEIATILRDFFVMTSKAYHKKYTGNRAKQWLFYLKMRYSEAEVLFQQIKRERDYDTIYRAISTHVDGSDSPSLEANSKEAGTRETDTKETSKNLA